MEKKKILFLRTNRVDPDPRVEKEVNSLIKNKNYYVEIHAWDRESNYRYSKDYLELTNGNVVIHRVGIKAGWGVGLKKNSKAFILYVVKTFMWLMRNITNYDCIHACDLQTIIPAFIPVIIFKKKLVYDVFDYFSDTANGNNLILKISKHLETKIINKADATIICSEQRIEQIYPANPKRLVIIHNSPSEDQFRCNKDNNICLSNNDKIKFVYIGNLVEDRNISFILDSAKELTNIELHIGGFGILSNMVEEYSKLYSNIFFYGKMSYSNVIALEKKCDCLIALYDPKIKNHRYAAPNKFYEALALGKPLIMFHNTGMDNYVDEYNFGITIDYSIDSLKSAMINVEKNIQYYRQSSKKEQDLFKHNFSWNIMENRLLDLYKEL